MAKHVHDTNGTTTSNTQTVHGVVYDVTTTRDSNSRVTGGTATPR